MYSIKVQVKLLFCLLEVALSLLMFSIGQSMVASKEAVKNGLDASTEICNLSSNIEDIHNQAKEITVQILASTPIGSGTIIRKEKSLYTVLTVAHVFRSSAPPYMIQTSDGQRYYAEVVSVDDLDQKDVVVMQFCSHQAVYSLADIAFDEELNVGDKIYAAGFLMYRENQSSSQLNSLFSFREGLVSLVLSQSLEEGYRLAYTNSIDLGMSGGPVLNCMGHLVGINGLRDDPIWEAPLFYEDGTELSPQIQELVQNSSLAILIEDIQFVFN